MSPFIVTINYERGISHLRRAYEVYDIAEAQSLLADCYINGWGVARDAAKAGTILIPSFSSFTHHQHTHHILGRHG
jgi:TPR repeat protein